MDHEKTGINDVDQTLEKIKIDKSDYTYTVVTIEGTKFHVLGRDREGLSSSRIISAIKKSWPFYTEIFGQRVRETIMVDYKFPMGGGSLGQPFAVGVYTTDSIGKDIQDYIKNIVDWKPQSNTFDYIKAEYSHFDDPVQAYTDDIVFHELGHFLFGFGLTQTNLDNDSVSWVSLGMGMVYDRVTWDLHYDQPSPLFKGVVDLWRNKFAKMKEVDQRLIGADSTNDEKMGVVRVQVYNHAKAMVYLQSLRKNLGATYFDSRLNELLNENLGQILTYDLLLKYLEKDRAKIPLIRKLEDDFIVR